MVKRRLLLLLLLFAPQWALAYYWQPFPVDYQWMLRANVLHMIPKSDSTGFTGVYGQVDQFSSATSLAVDVTQYFNEYLAMQLGLSQTTHELSGGGTTLGRLDLGDVDIMLPVFSFQYHFRPKHMINPYLGIGISRFIFKMIEEGSQLSSVNYDNSTGYVYEAGADVHLGDQWYVSAVVKKMRADVELQGVAQGTTLTTTVHVDPVIFAIGGGFRFDI